MVAYVIVFRDRTRDQEQLDLYSQKAPAVSKNYPVTILSYRSRHEVVEGPAIEAAAILEFPSFEEAKAWYDSPGYQEALKHRLLGGDHRAVIIDGGRPKPG